MTHQIAPFGLRMPDELKDWIRETAQRDNRSMNNMIVHLLEKQKAAAGGQFGDVAPAAILDGRAKGTTDREEI